MAAAVNEAHAYRPSDPASIEEDLKALWMDVARDAPVARALMANLVVFCERARGERVDFEAPIPAVPLREVVRRHPSRVIVLHHSEDDGGTRAPVAAAVSIATFGTPQARYGVEQIAVRSSCAEVSLPSIVRGLIQGDVPTSIWWTPDLSRSAPMGAVVAMGRQLVYDSRAWRDVRRGVQALLPFLRGSTVPDLADLNWRRLMSMRQAIVEAGRTMIPHDEAIAEISIVHRPGDGALAWLLAGWMASRLSRSADGTDVPIRVDERRHGDEILGVTIGPITASMTAQRVAVRGAGSAPPFHLAVRHESDADAVVSELGTLTHDVCLHDALAALARRFAA